jgi:hypothetical protein
MATSFQDDNGEQTIVGPVPVAEAPPTQFCHLLNYSIDVTPRRVAIAPEGMTIGRTAPAELVIANPEISRRHCRIEVYGIDAVLTDLGSTNGTYLDGQRLNRPARLRSGTIFRLGAFPIRYERRDLAEIAQEEEHSADLKRAEDYVRAILPQPILDGAIRTEWCFVPSAKLGGDAFGYQFLSERVFAGFLLDVSGHGIGSAMHAANVANTLRRRALPGVDFADPAAVAAGLNRMFPMEEHNGLMLTLWYFTYDLPSRQLRYCAAGHHPAFLVTQAQPEPAPLWRRGPAIGMMQSAKWLVGEASMPPGAQLLIFSDGTFEILTLDGRQWQIEDLRQVVRQWATPDGGLTSAIYTAVRAAARPGPLEDDFSALLVRFA